MTIIKGSLKVWLYDLLKAYGIGKVDRWVNVRPQVISITPSAPTKRRKYHKVTVEYAFDPTMFKNPKSIHAFVQEGSGFNTMFYFNPDGLKEDTLQMGDKSDRSVRDALAKHQELQQLFEKFMVEWKEAYARALAKDEA